jgi:hypothetical protein
MELKTAVRKLIAVLRILRVASWVAFPAVCGWLAMRHHDDYTSVPLLGRTVVALLSGRDRD